MTETRIVHGDCVEQMRTLDPASVDSVVCDPPYLIAFMGKDFDQQDGAHADPKRMQDWHHAWATEALRVLKPGGFLLAFGGTRTYHRLACAVEDAGFEIRDRFWTPGGEVAGELAWMFGSGFPKSLDVSKAIDKSLGQEGTYGDPKTARHAEYLKSGYGTGKHEGWDRPWMDDENAVERTARSYVPATEEARGALGWGTALKPAHEPIVVARKPLAGTVAANVLAHGTGALNIDACRVEFQSADDESESKSKNQHEDFGSKPRDNNVLGDMSQNPPDNYDAPGRWPANVILLHLDGCVRLGAREVASDGHYPADRPGVTEITTVGHAGQQGLAESHTRGESVEVWECADGCPVAELDQQSGISGSSGGGGVKAPGKHGIYGAFGGREYGDLGYGDVGGASRFFYCAKVSRAERNAGLDHFTERPLNWSSGDQNPGSFQGEGTNRAARNDHPTVKPIALMRWLIRLVCPPNGTVLDPFLGSGSTGCAAVLEDCVGNFIGIERDEDYLAIASARISFWDEHGEQGLALVREREQGERRRKQVEDAGQLGLFASASDPTVETP